MFKIRKKIDNIHINTHAHNPKEKHVLDNSSMKRIYERRDLSYVKYERVVEF